MPQGIVSAAVTSAQDGQLSEDLSDRDYFPSVAIRGQEAGDTDTVTVTKRAEGLHRREVVKAYFFQYIWQAKWQKSEQQNVYCYIVIHTRVVTCTHNIMLSLK